MGFQKGEQIFEQSYENDRVDWKLPEHRMEHFRAAGVIINEEQHITTTLTAKVVSIIGGVAVLQGVANVVSHDVPRQTTQVSSDPFSAALGSDNLPVPAAAIDIDSAAMAGLPRQPLSVGKHWTTALAVDTTLGSGHATFDHVLVGSDNGLLEIAIRGQGRITGAEYHLPKLLPGSISLYGTAWYDPVHKLVVQESYAIHNQLLKPMEGEQNGFDEQLSVDTSTHVTHL